MPVAAMGQVRRLPSGRYRASYVHKAPHTAPETYTVQGRAHGWIESERRLIVTDTWTPPDTRPSIRWTPTRGEHPSPRTDLRRMVRRVDPETHRTPRPANR